MVAIGFDLAESVAELETYRQSIDATNWIMANGSREMLRDLSVLSQSTKIIFNASGVEIFRQGYGDMGEKGWRIALEILPDVS